MGNLTHVVAVGVDVHVVHPGEVDMDHAQFFGQLLGKLAFADGMAALN